MSGTSGSDLVSYSMNKILTFIVFLSCFMAMNGCSESDTAGMGESDVYRISGVSEQPFSFSDSGKDGVMLYFSSDRTGRCNLSFIREKFNDEYQVWSDRLGKGDVDLMCLHSGGAYLMSNTENTNVSMSIKLLDGSGLLRLNFSLYSVRSEDYLTGTLTLKLNRSEVDAIRR